MTKNTKTPKRVPQYVGECKVGVYPKRRTAGEVEFRFNEGSPIQVAMMEVKGIKWVVPENKASSTIIATLVGTFDDSAIFIQKKTKGSHTYYVVAVDMQVFDANTREELLKHPGTTTHVVHLYRDGAIQVRWDQPVEPQLEMKV